MPILIRLEIMSKKARFWANVSKDLGFVPSCIAGLCWWCVLLHPFDLTDRAGSAPVERVNLLLYPWGRVLWSRPSDSFFIPDLCDRSSNRWRLLPSTLRRVPQWEMNVERFPQLAFRKFLSSIALSVDLLAKFSGNGRVVRSRVVHRYCS